MGEDTTFLGKGSFGQVRRVDSTTAEKTFEHHQHLIQEAIVFTYLSDSQYVVRCKNWNLRQLKLRTELWDKSLGRVLREDTLSQEQKVRIFVCIVRGLNDLHSRKILHCDLKPSNILINMRDMTAVLCDMGLSSIFGFAKVKQTASFYRLPDEMISQKTGPYHDMFSLAVLGTEMFASIRLDRQVHPERLNEIIESEQAAIGSKRITKCLKMCVNGYKTGCEAHMLLSVLGKACVPLPIPPRVDVENKLSKTYDSYIYGEVKRLSSVNKIKMGTKGYRILVHRLSNEKSKVEVKKYPCYIVAALVILSSLFGTKGFNLSKAFVSVDGSFTEEEILDAVGDLMQDRERINIIMAP